jgi:predicted Zn-dependent peptidase
VLTLDEALAEVERVDAEAVQRIAARLLVDEALRLAVVAPGRHVRGLDRRLRLPA